jgi:tRNA(Ile)-lysidine synthase
VLRSFGARPRFSEGACAAARDKLAAVDGVHRDISAFLRRSGIGRGERLLVAASGGADSTALLLALCALGMRLAVAHVHHGLRGGAADADGEFVAALAARLGVPFHLARVDAARRDRRSPEARARELRYAALESLRGSAGCAWTATAHTLDDQAETVLMRALRGTSPLGLAAIESCDARRHLLRPLLGVRRQVLRDYLRARGASWREDASNSNLELPRNRLRAEVLPALERVQGDAVAKLARLADQARIWGLPRRTAALEQLEATLEPGDGGQWLPLEVLARAGPGGARALLAAWLGSRAGAERLSSRHVERAARLAERAASGRALSLPGGLALFRDRDALWLGPAPGPRFPAPFERWLDPPQDLECPARGLALRWQRLDWQPLETGAPGPAGWALAPGSRVRVRSPAAGDSIARAPGCEPRPLRALFARAAWTRRQRARALVVEHDGRVVWVPGLALATPAHELRHGWKLVADRLSTPGDSC